MDEEAEQEWREYDREIPNMTLHDAAVKQPPKPVIVIVGDINLAAFQERVKEAKQQHELSKRQYDAALTNMTERDRQLDDAKRNLEYATQEYLKKV